MDANITCEYLLKQLKYSNLNFILQETPFSAYLTIRKSFVKNLKTNNLFPTFNDSEETLKKKIAALEAENLCLNSDILDQKSEQKNSEHIIKKLEEKVKNAEIQTFKHTEESKKEVEKHFRKVKDILAEKEKEIMKLKTISNNLNDDNVISREKIHNVSNALKISEKEALKAKNKCDNLESTVAKLKAEKGSLQKSIKKLEKSKRKETFEKTNSKTKEIKVLGTFHPENDDSEETDTDHKPIAYNFPVSPNSFELLDEEKDYMSENNNIPSSIIAKIENKPDFSQNSKEAFEKKENDEPEKKNNKMSPEQEQRVLKQIEKIMCGTSEIT